MFKAIVTITMLASLTASAQNLSRQRMQVSSKVIAVEKVDISEVQLKPFTNIAGDLTGGLRDLMNPLNEAEILIDKIVNMGQKVWTLVQKGKPTLNYSQYTATALPQGVQSWTQMQGWSATSQTVEVSTKNGFGKSTTLVYKVIFAHGGNVNGVGRYVGYATVEPAKIRAEWSAPSIDAQVSVPAVFNMGTTQNPVAAMKIQIKYTFDSGIQRDEYIDSYIVTGNGQIHAL